MVGLALAVAMMTRQRIHQLQRTQWALQARLNAHSAVNQYAILQKIEPKLDFGTAGSCEVKKDGADLYFVGRCRGVERVLHLPSGDVRRVREVLQ